MPTFRDAVLMHVQMESEQSDKVWADEHLGKPPRLFVSSLGGCPRAAYHAAVQHLPGHPFHREITHPHDPYMLERPHPVRPPLFEICTCEAYCNSYFVT